jgi:serine protease Do
VILASVVLVLATTSGLSAASLGSDQPPKNSESNADVSVTRKGLLRELNGSMEDLMAKVSPAVVQIAVTSFGRLEGPGQKGVSLLGRQRALGSGVIVEPDGYIVTNAHVVEGAQQVRVILPPPVPNSAFQVQGSHAGQVLNAKVIGIDRESDLAVIKIDARGLPTLSLANPQAAHQGQLVFAIGSPEGLEDSVTMGVVSSPLRQPDPDSPMVYIQTDAPINPGNSGGALVDVEGSLIGINTMILTQGGGSEGLGFAIPARFVRFVYRNLRKYGHVHRAEIGANVQEITPDLAAGLGLSRNWGVVISDVQPDGLSAAAGLHIGDIVVSIDHRPIFGVPGCTAALYLHPLDEPVAMEVLRGKKTVSLTIPVLEHHEEIDQLADVANLQNNLLPQLGVFVVELNKEVKGVLHGLRSDSGVVVVAQATTSAQVHVDLQPGDVIRTLNRTSIQTLDQLRSVMNGIKPDEPVVLQIERDGKLQYVAFELDN